MHAQHTHSYFVYFTISFFCPSCFFIPLTPLSPTILLSSFPFFLFSNPSLPPVPAFPVPACCSYLLSSKPSSAGVSVLAVISCISVLGHLCQLALFSFRLISHTELLMHLHLNRWEASRCLLWCACLRACVVRICVKCVCRYARVRWSVSSAHSVSLYEFQCDVICGSWWQFLIWLQRSLTSRCAITYLFTC